MFRRIVPALALLVACDEGGASLQAPPPTTPSPGTPASGGSGGGFAAQLAQSVDAGGGSAASGSGSGSSGSAVAASGSGSAVAASGSGSGSTSTSNVVPEAPVGARVPVKPPPELAAIKLSLSPNWDRDVGEAGTISLVVKIPGTASTRLFSFRYGYEDPSAPKDRDAYKRWLADQKILAPKLDRQRGAAWYLEGPDGRGSPTFRIVVQYGGKRLICGGSLYRDAASDKLGDLRDKTLIQAKEICETVTL